jgi:predicted nucleotidyltransferase
MRGDSGRNSDLDIFVEMESREEPHQRGLDAYQSAIHIRDAIRERL